MRTRTLFEMATLRTEIFLTLFKKAFLVLKFNILFPQSLDILKELNEKASLSGKMFLTKKKPFFGPFLAKLNEKKVLFLKLCWFL